MIICIGQFLPRDGVKQAMAAMITVAQKSELRLQVRPESAPEPSRRERNFWMRRQGAKNRR